MSTRKERLDVEMMSSGRLAEDLEAAAKLVDDLDGEKVEVELTADDKAQAAVDALVKRLEQLDGDEASIAVKAEISKAERDLEKAIKLLGQVDGEDAQVTLDARNDAAAKISALNNALDDLDTRPAATPKVDADTTPINNKLTQFDGQARSVVANFAGNVAGEMPGIAGAFGPLNMAVGQFAEYASEGNISLKDFGKALGPMAAIAAAAFLATKAYEAFTAKSKLAEKMTRATSDAVREASGDLERLEENLDALTANAVRTGDAIDILGAGIYEGLAADDNYDEISKINTALYTLGLTAEDLGSAVTRLGRDDITGLTQALANAGVDEYTADIAAAIAAGDDMTAIHGHLTDVLVGEGDSYDEASEKAEQLIERYREQIEAGEQLDDIADNNKLNDIAADQLNLAAAADVATAALIEEIRAANPDLSDFEVWARLTDQQQEHRRSVEGTTAAYEEWAAGQKTVEDFPVALDAVIQHIARGTTNTEEFASAMNVLRRAFPEMDDAAILDAVADATEEATKSATAATKELTSEKYDLEAAEEAAATAAEEAAEAYRDGLTAALEEQSEALQENIDLLDEQNDAMRAAVDAQYALEDALDEVEAKRQEAREAGGEDAEITADNEEAIEAYRDSVIDAVDAEQQLADEQAKANGVTRTRVQQIDAESRAYLNEAATVNGAMRDAILRHVAALNGIDPEVVTTVLTDADPDDIAQVEALLFGLANKRRVAGIEADATQQSLASTNRELNDLKATRYVPVVGNPDMSAVYAAINAIRAAAVIRLAFQAANRAAGDPHTTRGTFVVGEQGPEIVELPDGAKITPNHRLGSGQAATQQTINNTFITHVPAGKTSADVMNDIRRYERNQGPL